MGYWDTDVMLGVFGEAHPSVSAPVPGDSLPGAATPHYSGLQKKRKTEFGKAVQTKCERVFS